MKRKIIKISREECNGCGLCTNACAEGALALDDENKAVLLKEIYCDGMGACLDVCPTGALQIVERESEAYDPALAYTHVLSTRGIEAAANVHRVSPRPLHELNNNASTAQTRRFSGCPGSRPAEIPRQNYAAQKPYATSTPSELRQWPIQLHLVSPYAPYFKSTDLLLAADCTAFALGSFHHDLLQRKTLIIACPKLDDTNDYVDKLAAIIKHNNLNSLTVAIMTVPCCSGLYAIAQEALSRSGAQIIPEKVFISIQGNLTTETTL